MPIKKRRCHGSWRRRGGVEAHAWVRIFTSAMRLESKLQGELRGAAVTDCAANLAKVAVGHAAVWGSVIGNVEGVEEIGPEFHSILMPNREALENSHVDVLEARSTQRAWPHSAERTI